MGEMWLPLGHETGPRGSWLGHAPGDLLPPLLLGERAVGYGSCDLVPIPRLHPAGAGGCRAERCHQPQVAQEGWGQEVEEEELGGGADDPDALGRWPGRTSACKKLFWMALTHEQE